VSAPVEFRETEIPGVREVHVKFFGDARGFFAEAYSKKTWNEVGFSEEFVQDNLSKSAKGTLRGLHYQLATHGMGKLIRTVSGSVFDVAVDLRIGSPTFGKWIGRTLSAENGLALWIPAGFAHGFLALEDESVIWYRCTNYYAPEAERSLLFKDPTIGIKWPDQPTVVSERDLKAPCLERAEYDFRWQER